MASKLDMELQRYFDGELSPRRARQLRERADADPELRARLRDMGQMRDLVREAAQEPAQTADFSRLLARVQQGVEAEPASSSWGSLMRWGAVAASAVVAATLVLMLLWPVSVPSNDCVIESLEVGPGAVSTIFTIDDPGIVGATTVIWISDKTAEGSAQ